MKKATILIVLLFAIASAHGQIETKTIADGYLLYDFIGGEFKKNKKIKKGVDIFLLREFNKLKSYYVVAYKDKQYCLKGEYIDYDGLKTLNEIKQRFIRQREDSIKKIEYIKDSILNEKRLYKRRINDSIAVLEQLRQDRQTAIKDSIESLKMMQAAIILRKYSEDKKNLIKAGMPIEIEKVYTSEPNSAGGTDLTFRLKNISEKVIKYISITGYPINAVKDRCCCSIRRYSQTTNKGVGPIGEMESAEYNFENVWYNHTIDEYIPVSITIQYMNGSTLNISGSKLKKIIESPLLDKVYSELLKEYNIDLEELLKGDN